jgi:hypothetical protein
MNGTMTRVTMSAELAAELARVAAFVMVSGGTSEGEFTDAECERVMELVGDEFSPMMESELVEFANDSEFAEELAHAFVVACGARGGVVTEFVIVTAATAAILAEFAAQR